MYDKQYVKCGTVMSDNTKNDTFISFKFEDSFQDKLKEKITKELSAGKLIDYAAWGFDAVISPAGAAVKAGTKILDVLKNATSQDTTLIQEGIKACFEDHIKAIKQDINNKTVSNKLFNTSDTDFMDHYYVPLQARHNDDVQDIQTLLENFANTKPSHKIYNRIAFVCGSPGAGKSVEGRVFTYYQACKNRNKNYEKFNPLSWFGTQDD
ncbi:MAG: hypothetical protein ACJARD_001753, partial [Alphaproteobacteria bacterium]